MNKNISLPYFVGSLFENKNDKNDIIKVCEYSVSIDFNNNPVIKVGVNKVNEQSYENVKHISIDELKEKYNYTQIVMVGNQKYLDNGISLVEYEADKKDKQL